MIIGLRQRLSNIETDPTCTIELGESKIKRIKHSKTLGIITEYQLLWKKQVDKPLFPRCPKALIC